MHDWIFRKLISDYEDVKNPAVRDQYGKVAGVVGILSNTLLCVMKIQELPDNFTKFSTNVSTASVEIRSSPLVTSSIIK